jgi:hypothetical protein
MKLLSCLILIMCQISAFGQFDSTQVYHSTGPDYLQTEYPKSDGLTYNQFVGEHIAGFSIAHGWRRDTINGGFNKEIYTNPYISSVRFTKQDGSDHKAYRFENGKLFSGFITDTLKLNFTPNKVQGYLSGNPYYESKNITLLLRVEVVRGLLQGKAVLCGIVPQYGLYNNIPLSQCFFEDGEIVGVCKNWDLNSVHFRISNGTIHSYDEEYDYFEFKKLLELTEFTYVKGESAFTKHVIYRRNSKTGELEPESQEIH